ncbi:SRPBCC family protein [candidate division KSB1 bacterium]|nr:SRPBCC family protein [candidate division KSB1 bacterium]
MSMLKERIEIKKPLSEVWRFLDLQRWPEISSIFQHVEAKDSSMQAGSRFIVTAGPGETKVQYNVEIVACDESMGRLVYKRTGGPLPGTSEWVLTSSATGTKIEYTNHYQHDLNSTVLSSISRAMIRFLNDLRAEAEK